MTVCQNRVPLVNIKIAGKWMFIPLKMVLIGIDPYPRHYHRCWFDPSQAMTPRVKPWTSWLRAGKLDSFSRRSPFLDHFAWWENGGFNGKTIGKP